MFSAQASRRFLFLTAICLLASLPVAHAGSSPRTLDLADSGAVCPPGNARAVFLQLFSADQATLDALFKNGSISRIDRLKQQGFRGPALRERLARLSGASASAFIGNGAACIFYARKVTASLLTTTGDGLAVAVIPNAAMPNPSAYTVAACMLDDSLATGVSGVWQLKDRDVLLMRTAIEGEPQVIALHTLTVEHQKLRQEQMEFQVSASSIQSISAKGLLPSEPQESVANCLLRPATTSGGQR